MSPTFKSGSEKCPKCDKSATVSVFDGEGNVTEIICEACMHERIISKQAK